MILKRIILFVFLFVLILVIKILLYFHGTKRSRENKLGLDYTKIVLISKDNYISDKKVVVDDDEYNEVKKNVVQIVTEVLNYVDDYINHVTGITVIHPKQFARKYKYSTLPYFHDVMNI